MAKFPWQPDEPITASARSTRQTTGQITASAKVSAVGQSAAESNIDRRAQSQSQAWQAQAWMYYDEVGELHYSANFIGSCLSRCILTVGVPDDDGKVGPAFDAKGNPVTDESGAVIPGLDRAEDALQIIRALKSDVGGQPQMLRTMGLNLSIAGDLTLVGSPKVEGQQVNSTQLDVTQYKWEGLSTDEFRFDGTNYVRFRVPGSTPEPVKAEEVHAIRIWKSHPRYSELPDSSVRPQLQILEELLLLTREVRGEAMSRLANAGLLLVPDEIDYPGDDADNPDGKDGDAFTRDLIDTMSAAIKDKDSAAGVVPHVIRAPGALLHPDMFRHLQFPVASSDSAAKRAEAVQRFAQGVDLPVEIVTGHAGTTFANAVQIDDSLFKSHIEPLLEIICDALTVAYLRPALGGDTPLVVHYDATELVARPNRAQDAKDTYDRMELSGAALRTATGFSESDKPEEDEVAKRIENKRASTPPKVDVGGDPAAGAPLDQGGLDKGNNLDGNLQAAIRAAAEVTIDRAVRRTGARLRSKAQGDQSIRSLLSQVPDAEVAVTLGRTKVMELISDDLFHGEFDSLMSWSMRQTGDKEFTDQLMLASLRMAERKLYYPRSEFPVHELPVMASANG